MADENYEAFVRYVFEEEIEPRLVEVQRWRRHGHPLGHPLDDEFGRALKELREAHRLLTFIARSGIDDFGIYGTFRSEALARLLLSAEEGLRIHNTMAESSGVTEAMDRHFVDLADGLEPEHLPPNEPEVLTNLGFPEVASHLRGMTFEVRSFARRHRRAIEEHGVSGQLREALERVDRASREHRAMAEQREASADQLGRKPRKWWTGLGKIVAGTGTTLVDIGLAAGFIPGLDPQARATMLSSATLGIGALLEGVGACRGE